MSDELHWNKIFGAVLATVLVILGAREIAAHVFQTEPPEKPGYKVAVAETSDGGAAAPALLPDWGVVLAKADVAAGQTTFAKCQACHNNAQGGPNMIGPNLYGVVGRPTASHPGLRLLRRHEGARQGLANWTYDQIFQFLNGPQDWVPGTKMTVRRHPRRAGPDQRDRLSAQPGLDRLPDPPARSEPRAQGRGCRPGCSRRCSGRRCRACRPGRDEAVSTELGPRASTRALILPLPGEGSRVRSQWLSQ